MSALGARIREARKSRGLTQTQLADTLGTSQGWLSQWERGTRTPSVDWLSRLADALGVSMDWLAGRTEPRSHCQNVRNAV